MEHFLFFCLAFTFLSPSLGYSSINGYTNKLGSKHLMRDFMDTSVCFQDAVCTPVHNVTCFGTVLPYFYTSVALAEDSVSQFEVQDNLALWQGLRSIPRCWAVIQPLLCAVYMPKCENGTVFLPTQEMCRITRNPCRSVEVKHGWPPFLRCENKKLFPPRCRNPLQEVKFNTSYKCIPPLVETDNPDNWFYEVEGCGIQCRDPFYTVEDHNSTHNLIMILASVCFVTTLFTVITFMISWKSANRYPEVIIFYINVCLVIVSFGWLIQFFPGARDEIVCTHDGAIRRQQPQSGEHLCSITFLLIYFFLIAAVVWFVILTYAWHVVYRQAGALDTVKKKFGCFHIAAWSIPLILTTTVMAINKVDGDSISGICFVGYSNMYIRIGFLLAPIGVAVLVGGIFLACVMYTLIKVKLNSKEVAHLQVKKIRKMLIKIGIFSAFILLFITCSFACHAYDFMNRQEWDESLREYIVCLAMNSANTYSSLEELPKCHLKSKPNIAVVRLHLICFFGFGITMSLWVWTRASVESWKRFFYGFCAPAERSAAGVKRYQIIRKAYEKRHEINRGRTSLSLNSTHEDLVGMNLDANSVTSREITPSFAAVLTQLLHRRNAISGIDPRFVPRHYSSASDVSRHISVDSFNQPNLDSLSMQISEQEYAHALRHQRRKTRKERERFLRANRIAPWFPSSRRGSDTSLQSSLMAASIVAAAKKAGAKVTKATSTGDLETVPRSVILPPIMLPPANRPQIQRQVVNPPFTHGMTDNSHRLDSRVPSVASAFAGANTSQRFTPNQCPVIPNSIMGVVRPPIYGSSYDVLNSGPYGYLGSGMYPPMNGMYPGYPYGPDFGYNPYGTFPYPYTPYNDQYQQNILPMTMTVDSASEAEIFPIFLSDSEFTDTGHRSYDESQLMTTHRLIQEQLQAQAAASAVAQSEPMLTKPGLEPQACAKTQFLKRMGSFNSKTAHVAPQTRPPSGRKSPHSEAPPPSPVGSSKSLNDDESDDVFDDPSKESHDLSTSSLPQATIGESVFQKIKSKFRRAASFIQNTEESGGLELTSRPCHSSLGQLSKISSSVEKTSLREVQKETMLNPSEGVSLLNSDAANENVSR